MVGQTTEWAGAAATAPIDCLVLDGSWAEGETGVVLARWRPRLAPGAAVLVHGINPGQGGSLLWRDLGREHPGALRFELPQGAGLGLLLPESAASPTVLRDLCELPPKATADFKTLCAVLGARWAAGQQIAAARREAAELGASVSAARRRNEELRRRIDLLEQEQVAVLAAERAVLAAERAARQSERAARQAERAQLVAKMQMTAQRMKSAHVEELARMSAQAESAAAQMTAAHAAEIHRRSAATEAMLSQAAEAHAAALALLASRAESAAREKAEIHAKTIARLRARARAAEGALAEIAASTSWRATRRIIRAASWLPNSWRAAGRRSLRLAWWTVTGRLVTRLRHRRRTQRALALFRASPLFDPLWYARAYPDVALSGLDPTAHFAAHGAAENRDAGPAFDAGWYRQRYPDVAAARIHPLLHFLQHGAAEGREWRAVVPALPDPQSSKIPAPAGPAIPEADVVPETPDDNRAVAYALPEKPAVPPVPMNTSWEFAAALREVSADYGGDPAPSFAETQVSVAEPAAPEEVPPQPEAEELSAIVPRLELLGRDLPEITLFPVTAGFVIGCTPPGDLRRALESAETALEAIGQRRHASIMLAGHDATVDLADFVSWTVARLPPGTAPGLAAAHNRMMERAFAAGAEVYLTAHPGGVFHPEALIAVMRMVRANGRRALVEAARAPRKLPRPVDPECYEIPGSLAPVSPSPARSTMRSEASTSGWSRGARI